MIICFCYSLFLLLLAFVVCLLLQFAATADIYCSYFLFVICLFLLAWLFACLFICMPVVSIVDAAADAVAAADAAADAIADAAADACVAVDTVADIALCY